MASYILLPNTHIFTFEDYVVGNVQFLKLQKVLNSASISKVSIMA